MGQGTVHREATGLAKVTQLGSGPFRLEAWPAGQPGGSLSSQQLPHTLTKAREPHGHQLQELPALGLLRSTFWAFVYLQVPWGEDR